MLKRLIIRHFPKAYVCLHTVKSLILEPENFNGHVEYKRTLAKCSDRRIQDYATQMHWRIMENIKHQYAIYYIGIDDDGSIIGLDTDDIMNSIKHFYQIAQSIGASLTGINLVEIIGDRDSDEKFEDQVRFPVVLKIGVKIKKQSGICPILC